MSDTVAIIVAGGLGIRAGADRPKQWALLNGKRVIDWSIDTLCSHSGISQLVVTASPELGEPCIGQTYVRAEPGSTRNQSVRSGLRLIRGTAATKVLIHDARGLDCPMRSLTASSSHWTGLMRQPRRSP